MQQENDKYIVWNISTLAFIILGFVLFAFPTIYIDPLFHYHAPLEEYEYLIDNERYQNDGILRHFDYDGIITGTSMVENFKTSEANKMFDASFIKVPFWGARYKEVNDNLQKAYDTGKNIKYVVRCLDYSMLIQEKDAYKEDMEYPTYLYNDNLFDDVKYVLNKTILLDWTRNVIKHTEAGGETTSFDDYANWNKYYTFGEEAVLSTYEVEKRGTTPKILSKVEKEMVVENVQQNVTALAEAHPETTFMLFFPPYSICYWHSLKNNGQINWRIDAELVAIEEILKHSNIKLYSFCNNFELVCDLDNYKDQAHYGEWINSWILEQMCSEEYQITKDNYCNYIRIIREFYNEYDYSPFERRSLNAL